MATCALPPDLREKWQQLGDAVFAEQVKAVLIMSTCFFILNRTSHLVFGLTGLVKDPARRNLLASCVGSVVHCIIVSVVTYEELCQRDWKLMGFLDGSNGPKFDLGSPNSSTGVAAIIFCYGYMLADQIFMYIWCPWETLFILHHWATLIYMSTVLVCGTGDLSCCLCICLGEVTNPINNCMQASDILVSEALLPSSVNRVASAALSIAFFFIRLLYAPFGVCYVICHYYLISGQQKALDVHILVRLLWCILPLAVTHASVNFLRGLAGDVVADTTTTVNREKRDKTAAKKTK